MKINLKSERLILRPVKLNDAPNVFNAVKLPQFPEQLPLKEMATLNQVEDWLKSLQNLSENGHVFSFIAEKQASRNIVGQVTLSKLPEDKTWALAFWTHPEHWGKGYATEMAELMLTFGFRELGAKKIWAGAGKWNKGSCRVLEKIGMEFSGTNSKGYFAKGIPISTREYEILLEKWRIFRGFQT